jgi:coatomer protein complex subunit gamma
MVHLIIKELAHSAEDIIMVTSTIMKDTGGGTDAIYRPNAIRALCRIIDVSVPGNIKRTRIDSSRARRSKVLSVS